MTNNIPIHNPLFPPSMEYGSDDAESVSVLVEVDETAVRRLLKPTPFSFISAHAWIEVIALRTAWGVESFCGGGVIVPARYRDTVGGFYAFCYIDTDDALALGREPFGYPKKYARSHLQKTGRAVTGSMKRKDAVIEVSVVVTGSDMTLTADVPRYPHLLLQTFPSAETTEALLTRVIARNTSQTARMVSEAGEAAVTVVDGPGGNELAWMTGCTAVAGCYARGTFHGALGNVLGTEQLGSELLNALEPLRAATRKSVR
jgi:acetoacetate decarboxylase